ncbi:deaminase domain-containing protein [Flavobacterium sp. N502540]|uniref:deaminase domain-containing protein n=1 Tax=Flavobacterium sp. N502540 TaxID=2986838 RepID=UPI00222417B3|nr:deaminase domain-containing protein [Flavobacterium sp. N502540]
MKNRIKFYLTLWIVLFAFLNVNAQCETIMRFFKDDMYTSKELVAFAEKEPQKAFDSWKVLYNEKTGLTKNIEELNLVSKNLDEIKNVGGYVKWKDLKDVEKFPTPLNEGKNIFRGYASDYLKAKTRFKQFRENNIYELRKKYSGNELLEEIQKFDKRNLAYFDGKIDNLYITSTDVKISGNKFDGEPIFDSYKIDKQSNINTDSAWSREFDTEYVGLSEIAQKLGGKKGAILPKVKGEITIASELPYCISCQGVIQDFANMFPNVKINLVDGIKNIK